MQILRNKHHDADPLWHVQLVLLATIMLQLLLPQKLSTLPLFIIPGLELVSMAMLQIVTPKTATFTSQLRRTVVIVLIGLIAFANAGSLQLLITALFHATSADAPQLLTSSLSIYATNVVVFALLFWEMDGGGPGVRRDNRDDYQDFLFPQQDLSTPTAQKWHPTFFDYLYISVTNATAFSPTDTMPLSRRAKAFMGAQAFLSLLVLVLVAARAINIL